MVTLGTLSGVTGLGLILSGGEPTMVGSTFLLRLASGSFGPFGYPVWVAISAVLVAHIALYHTRFGVHLLATGGQVESASALGIRTNRVKIAAYTISGFCAGIAALLLVARIGSAEPQINTSLLLNSVAAVVLGRRQPVRWTRQHSRPGDRSADAHRSRQRADAAQRFGLLPALGRWRHRGAGGTDHAVSEMSAVNHSPSADAILACEGLSKHFGGIRAFTDVAFQARRGEVTAVIGDNGAGKSTLIRCLVGVHVPDAGDIFFDGRPHPFANPDEARKAGIETVHQNLALIDELTVAQNLFLNREIVRRIGPLALLDRKAMKQQARAMLSRLSINMPSVSQRVRRLSGGQRQAISICRAAGSGAKLVVMDEPTAALGVQETANVEALIRRLREQAVSVILVSHNFDQVRRLSDQIWVMRAGRMVATVRASETTGNELVALVTGAA